MKAVILAGGLGTRIRGAIAENTPKPMAPIKGKPFLEYLVSYLQKYKVQEIVMAVGYKALVIMEHFSQQKFSGINIRFSVEDQPLGTGGAIKKALETIDSDSDVVIANGDSFFPINLNILRDHFHQHSADVSLGLKYLENRHRFGSVVVDGARIIDFNAAYLDDSGLINGGIYITNSGLLDGLAPDLKFSFETYISEQMDKLTVTGLEFKDYFFDLGVPEDYHSLKNKSLENYIC